MPTAKPKTETAVEKRPAFALRNADDVNGFISAQWLEVADADDAVIGILDQVFSSQTADELFADTNTVKWGENVGRPYELTGGVRFLHSDDKYITDKTVVPAFAVVQAIDIETGEQVILSTGGYKVVAQLKVGFDRGWLNGRKLVLQSNQTRQGFTAYSLADAK